MEPNARRRRWSVIGLLVAGLLIGGGLAWTRFRPRETPANTAASVRAVKLRVDDVFVFFQFDDSDRAGGGDPATDTLVGGGDLLPRPPLGEAAYRLRRAVIDDLVRAGVIDTAAAGGAGERARLTVRVAVSSKKEAAFFTGWMQVTRPVRLAGRDGGKSFYAAVATLPFSGWATNRRAAAPLVEARVRAALTELFPRDRSDD